MGVTAVVSVSCSSSISPSRSIFDTDVEAQAIIGSQPMICSKGDMR